MIADFPALTHLIAGWAAKRHYPDPDDLAQEVALRVWLAEQRGQPTCRAFAFVVARNLAIDWQRHRQVIPLEPLPSIDPPARAHDWDAGMEAERILARLEPDQARALRLTAQGYSGREIAVELGVTYDAAKALVYRGRVRARAAA